MFQFVYIYCTKTAFEPFACIDKEDGKSYMRFEPKIRCGEGHHLWLAPMGMVFGCLYGIGIPLIFSYIVHRNRKTIKFDQVLRVLGTGSSRDENPKYYEFRKRYYKLYYRFKPRYFYWGQVILLRKFLVVLCTVFLKSNPTLQATCALMILFVSYSMHIRSLPYLRNDLLGADDADMEKVVGDVGGNEGGESTVRAKALTLINKNPKAMSLRKSLRMKKEKVGKLGGQLSQTMSRTVMKPSQSFITLVPTEGSKHVDLSHTRSKSSSTPTSSTESLSTRLKSLPEQKSIRHFAGDDQLTRSKKKEKIRRLDALLRMGSGTGIQIGGISVADLKAGKRRPSADTLWDQVRNQHVMFGGDNSFGENSGAGGDGDGNGGGGGDLVSEPIMTKAGSMYGVTPDPAVERSEVKGGARMKKRPSLINVSVKNVKISKTFLMDYNTMETIFHFCSILILLCALMFESGNQGDLSGTKAAKTAKRNEALAGDTSTAGEGVNQGAEHYLLVVFVISVVALSSIYFMFALLTEVFRSFSHFARVMKQRKQAKKAMKAAKKNTGTGGNEPQEQVEMTQRYVKTKRMCWEMNGNELMGDRLIGQVA
jgi:hypothetical protein